MWKNKNEIYESVKEVQVRTHLYIVFTFLTLKIRLNLFFNKKIFYIVYIVNIMNNTVLLSFIVNYISVVLKLYNSRHIKKKLLNNNISVEPKKLI